jgi:enolase
MEVGFRNRRQKAFSSHSLSLVPGKRAIRLGLEGAFIPSIKKTEEALDLLSAVGRKDKLRIIPDVAASSFFKKGKYYFEEGKMSRGELLNFYLKLCKKYPISALEDPFSEEDWNYFQKITRILGKRITIIGDDLLVTNIQRIKKAVRKKACNGLILKPNQIGTVSEAIGAAKLAIRDRWKVFVKHRSGETKDDFIADLAVGLGAGWIMAGAPSKPERMVKYNRLLKIEKEFKKYA